MLPLPGPRPAFAAHPGGSAYNSAIGLARLQVPVALMSGISTDALGRMLVAGLTEAGVATDALVRSDRPSPLAFVDLERGLPRYSFYDAGSAGRMVRPADLPEVPRGVSAALFGGLSLATPPVAESFAGLADRLAPGHVLMLDPNVRPALIGDEAACRARLARMLALADIIKLSREDLDWLYPGLPRPAQVAALLDFDPGFVCLTLDADGAEIHKPGCAPIILPACPAEVVDTVGAGDTVNAGLLAALWGAGALSKPALRAAGAELLRDALGFALRAAAVTVGRAGADPPTRAELG